MNFQEAMELLEERYGSGKDNTVSLATISLSLGENGLPCPYVREIDAFYEDGTFYAITYGLTKKIKDVNVNPNISIAVKDVKDGVLYDFVGIGEGKNLGWVLKPENSHIREKMHKVFAEWYHDANDENDENFVVFAMYLKKGTLRINHGQKYLLFDFDNKEIVEKP